MSDQTVYSLEMRNISKTYPGVQVLHNVSLKLRPGTVHVLMGENGAGKSTLMKIIAGIVQPTSGDIVLFGKKVKFNSPRDGLRHGISMIHQELSPIPDMTIAENLFLGREHQYKGTFVIHYKKMNEEAAKLLSGIGLKIDPGTKMRDLTVAETQMVEIAKAISYNSDIIIMDEPTSAITDREVETLFSLINQLKSQNKSIIYISHKMDEIYRIADEISVLRDGHYIGTYAASQITPDQLINKMVDRELKEVFPEKKAKVSQEVVLKVKNLSHSKKFRDISFEVRAGEIVGIAGLMGSGRTEVVESIFGIRPLDSGEIYIRGTKVKIRNAKEAIRHRIALITEDRKQQGLILPLSVKDNMTLLSLKDFQRGKIIIDRKKEQSKAKEYVSSLKIKTAGLQQSVGSLSGGNQQKVVLAKWLMKAPEILIFDEPTRGVDIGAKAEIYKLIADLAEQGVAIILISSELPEVLGMSDRIIVFHEGKISGELQKQEATQEKIMKLATGTNNREVTSVGVNE
ncbi:sugar ABC transporter ATP-binding protein [Brevibacillus massiliensis]|uniref:sugar ABC transporter ATP-binding protein n=1 Tax=Brevibacillus massiliensis TaxID=1118054 RepID=UPI0002E90724|nr:sugar ABC transporter ATP-binding protein [Brevibacillus massiliensis]